MDRRVGACLLGVVLGGVVFALGTRSGAAAAGGVPRPALVMTAGELKWSEDPTIRGAHIAVLWGDPQTGAHGVLKMLPAGAGLATHIHSHDQRAVGITGTVTLAVEGGPAKDMGPGSFAFIPAGVKHAADCKPGADCTYFEEQPGPADLKFVEAASGRD